MLGMASKIHPHQTAHIIRMHVTPYGRSPCTYPLHQAGRWSENCSRHADRMLDQ